MDWIVSPIQPAQTKRGSHRQQSADKRQPDGSFSRVLEELAHKAVQPRSDGFGRGAATRRAVPDKAMEMAALVRRIETVNHEVRSLMGEGG